MFVPAVAVGAVGVPVNAGLARFAFVDKSGGVYVNTPLELLYARLPSPEALAGDPTDKLARVIASTATPSHFLVVELYLRNLLFVSAVSLSISSKNSNRTSPPVSYTHLRAHET